MVNGEPIPTSSVEQRPPQGDAKAATKPIPAETREDLNLADSRSALQELATTWEDTSQRMQEKENAYLDRFGSDEKDESKKQAKNKALKERYQNEKASHKVVSEQINNVPIEPILRKRSLGIPLGGWELQMLLDNRTNPALTDEAKNKVQNLKITSEEQSRLKIWQERMSKSLYSEGKPDEEGRQILKQAAEIQIKLLFLNKDGGIYNPEKYNDIIGQNAQYLDLLFQCQSEGRIPQDLKAGEVFALVSENISALALQDRASSENTLGDHGERHLVRHNIQVAIELANQLQEKGVPVTSLDKLLLHQTMLYHDLGYAMEPVRDAINKDGPKGQDAGHNILAAQFVRERTAKEGDLWRRVFGKKASEQIHTAIIYHDKDSEGKNRVDFSAQKQGETAEEAKGRIIESIVRTADNTQAFEDKLPELLYTFPETIKYMRLLKTAGETGDTASINAFKGKLIGEIEKNQDISDVDKKALTMAVMRVEPQSYNFTVGRIFGNRAKVSVIETKNASDRQDFKVGIGLQESAIHQEVMGLFHRESYDILKKFIANNLGIESGQVNLDQDRIEAGNVIIAIKKGEQKTTESTDYQTKIREMLNDDPRFQEFVNKDNPLSVRQEGIGKLLDLYNDNKIDESQFRLQAEASLPEGVDVSKLTVDEMKTMLSQRTATIKQQRTALLNSYRQSA